MLKNAGGRYKATASVFEHFLAAATRAMGRFQTDGLFWIDASADGIDDDQLTLLCDGLKEGVIDRRIELHAGVLADLSQDFREVERVVERPL